MRPAAWPRPGDDLGHAVSGHVVACYDHPARKRRVVGKDGTQLRPAAGTRSRDVILRREKAGYS